MPAPLPDDEIERRLATVRAAAIELFASHGFRATSMSAIAAAAGLSRPALYQHFASREDVFRSALLELLERANRAALEALEEPGDLTDRLDQYLQRCRGDVIGPLLGSPHGDELIEARNSSARDVAERAHDDRRRALLRVLTELTGNDRELARRATDLLELGSLGLKHDEPSPDAYRERLRTLAAATALAIRDGDGAAAGS